MLEAVAFQDAVPGELLARLADAAGLAEQRPGDFSDEAVEYYRQEGRATLRPMGAAEQLEDLLTIVDPDEDLEPPLTDVDTPWSEDLAAQVAVALRPHG